MKPSILVVLPYGMCFRNIVQNEALWGYLKSNYTIDLLTPLEIPEKNKLGIRNVYRIGGGLRLLLNKAVLRYRKLLVYGTFFLDLGMGSFLNQLYLNWLKTKAQRRDLLFWAALNNSKLFAPFKALLGLFPLFYPIKLQSYAFVLLGHNSESECVLIGQLANKQKIPVVCIPLGLDNMFIHGPLLMNPDLLLLWGDEQADEFTKYQCQFNPSLKRAKALPVGSLIYDTYKQVQSNNGKEKVILFPASIESFHGGQASICQTIVHFLQQHREAGNLVIRVRPGLDTVMWERFQADYPELVSLQHPEGASYDKSATRSRIDLQKEYDDIKLFVDTLRQASLLVIPGFSTMYTDALAFGIPSVVVANNQHMSRYAMNHLRAYQHSLVHYPHWREYNVVGDLDELYGFLRAFFLDNHKDKKKLLGEELFKMQALAFDGRAGSRAVQAIKEYFHGA